MCKEYNGNWAEALEVGTMAIRDAILCPYQMSMTGPLFAAFVLLGLINMPIYVQQRSVVIPMVITLAVGGLVLTQIASLGQMLLMIGLLMVLGIGPVLVLRRLNI